MQRISKWFLLVLVIGTIVLVGLKKQDSAGRPQLDPKPASFFEFNKNQLKFSLYNYEGQLIKSETVLRAASILVFSAAWCHSGIDQLVKLSQLKQDFHNDQVNVIYMSLDQSPEVCKNYMIAHQLTLPSLMVTEHQLNNYPSLINGVPTIMLLDRSGELLEKIEGDLDLNKLKEIIVDEIKK